MWLVDGIEPRASDYFPTLVNGTVEPTTVLEVQCELELFLPEVPEEPWVSRDRAMNPVKTLDELVRIAMCTSVSEFLMVSDSVGDFGEKLPLVAVKLPGSR